MNLVPHLKDLPHVCLEPEAQGHDMTFRVCNLDSKQPHLYSAYVVSVPSQCILVFSGICAKDDECKSQNFSDVSKTNLEKFFFDLENTIRDLMIPQEREEQKMVSI